MFVHPSTNIPLRCYLSSHSISIVLSTSTQRWLRAYFSFLYYNTFFQISIAKEANFPPRNVLQLPFRRTHPISLSDAIKQYISTKYDQHPDMFAEDLLIIDRLRTDAVNVREPHTSGISRLVAYAAQLKWLGGKFPIDVSGPFLLWRKGYFGRGF